MLEKFKQWVYKVVVDQLMEEIASLYDALENEKQLRAEIAEAERKARVEKAVLAEIAKRLAEKEARQNRCTHLKGGRYIKSPSKDFNIWIHTFPTGLSTIRCLTCSKEWKGEQLNSDEVKYMLANTTNTPSSSEVAHGKGYTYTDSAVAVPDETKVVFLDPSYVEAIEKVRESNRKWEIDEEEERKNNPLWPFLSRVYVKWWDKMYKKLSKKRRRVE